MLLGLFGVGALRSSSKHALELDRFLHMIDCLSQGMCAAGRPLCRHRGRTPLDTRRHPRVSTLPHFRLPTSNKARYDYLASKTHTIIVPGCGFDSVPSDIIVHLSNRTLKALAGPDASIDESISAWKVKGAGLSGGTFQTLIADIEEVPRDKFIWAHQDWALSTGTMCEPCMLAMILILIVHSYQGSALQPPPPPLHTAVLEPAGLWRHILHGGREPCHCATDMGYSRASGKVPRVLFTGAL